MFLSSVVLFESFRKEVFNLTMFSELFNTFSASYTSFLSVVNQAKPFDSISQLEEQTTYIIGAQEKTSFQSMFIVSRYK